jgi:NAD-dependent dihydropyrimidine dehydrogenase PreA subunit
MAAGTYMNIPREEIPWYPVIDKDLCTNCGACIDFCSNGVFAMEDIETKVVAPYNCVVGCSACAAECPSEAIRFPDKQEFVQKLRELRAKYAPRTTVATG